MATRARVTCINKTDRLSAHERIRSVGGVNSDDTSWKLSQEAAIRGVEDGTYDFFVHAGGRTVEVIVATSRLGNKYLKTEADGEQPDNLLSLPECP